METLRPSAAVEEPTQYPKEHRRKDPQHLADRMPMISENDEDRRAATAYARHYQNEQEPG